MKFLKTMLRHLGLTVLIILAVCGLGIGNFLYGGRERYLDKEIRTEQTDKKEEESESESDRN